MFITIHNFCKSLLDAEHGFCLICDIFVLTSCRFFPLDQSKISIGLISLLNMSEAEVYILV